MMFKYYLFLYLLVPGDYYEARMVTEMPDWKVCIEVRNTLREVAPDAGKWMCRKSYQ